MTTTISPALTADEWTRLSREGTDRALLPFETAWLTPYEDAEGNWTSLNLKGPMGRVNVNRPDMAAIAALALHRQPFGFTHEDLRLLRNVSEGFAFAPSGRALLDLAARIEALLPPEPGT